MLLAAMVYKALSLSWFSCITYERQQEEVDNTQFEGFLGTLDTRLFVFKY